MFILHDRSQLRFFLFVSGGSTLIFGFFSLLLKSLTVYWWLPIVLNLIIWIFGYALKILEEKGGALNSSFFLNKIYN